jgi:hypothetical protein
MKVHSDGRITADNVDDPSKAVVVDYSPHQLQWKVHESRSRFRVIAAHRRFGKTTLAINELIMAATSKPGRYWYVAPTYRQAKTIAYDMLLHYLPHQFIAKKNEQDLTIKLHNGSELALKGAENKDSLRGVGLSGLILDEVGQMDKDVWEAILSPTLQDDPKNKGWAIFIGTPRGRNFFFHLFQNGLNASRKEWESFHFGAYDTAEKVRNPPRVTKPDLDKLKEELSEDVFREEWLAEFLEGAGTVFRNVNLCIEPKANCYKEPNFGHYYQMGVDLARLRDWTVITIVDVTTNRVVYWERFNKLDWEFQKLRVANLSDRFNNARIVVDATGVGDPIAIDLERMGLSVLAYKITSSEPKIRLIENLKLRIEQKQVIIPDESQLIRELESYEFSTTDSGRTVYEAPSGEHDDCVMSLALALWDVLPQTYMKKEDFIPEYCDSY